MLDLNLIRSNPEYVKEALKKREYDVDFSELLEWDARRRALLVENESLKAERNRMSKEIPALKKQGKDASELLAKLKEMADQVKAMDEEQSALEDRIYRFVVALPNLPAEDVVAGGKENNQVVKVYGEKPAFDWEPKNHVDLCTDLGLIDYERGVKMGGNGFWLYTGLGARLEWALLNYFISEHLKDGYTFMLPPHLLTYDCGLTAGQFPKFEDDVYRLTEEGFRFLLPTAETALINLYRGEILSEDELPKKLFAYTPCYRREAGAYRASERGMIRGHQFNKVEMFIYPPRGQRQDAQRTHRQGLPPGRGPGAALSPLQAGRGRLLRFHGHHLRHRTVDPQHERIQGVLLRLQRARLSGPPRQHPLPPQRNEEAGVRAHAQRLRPGHQPPDARHRRAVPAAGRQRHYPGKAASLSGRHGEDLPQALNDRRSRGGAHAAPPHFSGGDFCAFRPKVFCRLPRQLYIHAL